MVARPGARWLILTQYYAPEIGAPQIRLRSLVRELRRHGLDVEVLTGMPNYPTGRIAPGYEGRWRMTETIDSVKIRRTWLYAGTGRAPHVRLANYFSFTLSALIELFTSRRPEVLFVESQPLSLGVNGLLMKWLRGVPYVYNVPDLQVDVARQLKFMRSELLLGLARRLEDLFLRQSWKVSTVTHQFIEHFVGRGVPRSQVSFLPNGADTEFLRPAAPDPELCARWGLAGKKTFAYVGTHAYYHGLDTLVDAAALLKDRTDIAVLMVGSGPERARLRERATALGLTNLVFGQSPYEEMARLYSIAYASVATLRDMSVASGMRLSKILPSLSCAVPVVYSGAGEAAEILEREGCGIVVGPEQPRALADAIAALADEPARQARMGQAGRRLVEHEYSWSVIVHRWLTEIGWSGQAADGGAEPALAPEAAGARAGPAEKG